MFSRAKKKAIVSVGIIWLPHISNYTDFDSLEFDPRFMVEYVRSSGSLNRFDVVIIPGSKNVFFDFRFIVERNLKEEIIAYYKSGGKIAGICGGFQMIGKSIKDPHGIEGNEKEIATLGLLPVNSVLDKIKVTERIKRNVKLPCQDKTIQVECYEIHMGKTTLLEKRSGQYSSNNCKTDQSITATDDGRVWGTYMHGIFDNDELRDCFIKWVKGADYSVPTVDFSFIKFKEMNYERLADIVEENVDVPAILRNAGINIL